MKKTALLFLVTFLVSIPAFSQALEDFVVEVRGDTLVIADYIDMGEPSTLNNVVELDTIPPAGRVYMLKTNGYYPIASTVVTSPDYPVEIYGEMSTRLVQSNDPNAAPPLISGHVSEGGSNAAQLRYQNDLTIKNMNILPAAADGRLGWALINPRAPELTLVLENCLFEFTRWVIINSNAAANSRFYIRDNYFVNLSGQPCRRNGGVYDVAHPTDTMWVENNTHVMSQGMMYKFRNYFVGKAVFNHNTFVNGSGQVFETLGYQSNLSVTNNLFVNSNIQPYHPGLDAGETDADNLPMGLVNVRPLPAEMEQVDRKILVEGNAIYWDPILSDMVETLNSNEVNFRTDWVSQMITMNSRTQDMFDDDATYPYLTEGVWYEEMPNFTDPQDLFTDQLTKLKEFTLSTVDTTSTDILTPWRLVNDPAELYTYSDWPIPVDLSYDNEVLLSGATGGFPVGDLNWFADQKTAWEAQRDEEYAAIETALQEGSLTITSIKELGGATPNDFQLDQNYPNPFNPTTTINFALPNSGNVTLKVYNLMGEEVATLVNGFMNAQSYSVEFDASTLASGIYVYTLNYANFTQSKKMVLMK